MPRRTIAEENKVGGDAERFPFLKLNHDERARIACLDLIRLPDQSTQLAPMCEYVHSLRAPKIVDGRAQRETRDGKDGSKYEDWAFDFIGQPICLGAEHILTQDGRDVQNCPVCRASQDNEHITPPVPYFAMNIVRYATRPGSFELANPFSALVIAWKFPSSRFDKLCDIARDDAPNGDLSQVDVKLGPCKDAGYQKYDIGVVSNAPATWRLSAELGQYIRTLWTAPGNRATDEQLSALCGRPVTNRAYLDDAIARFIRQWHIADVQQAGGGAVAPPVPFQQGMQAMAGDAAAAYAAQAAPVVPVAPQQPAPQQPAPQVPTAPQPQVQVPNAQAMLPPGQALMAAAQPDMAALAAQQQAVLAQAGVQPGLIPGQEQLIPGHPGGIAEFGPQAGPQVQAGYVPGPALPQVPMAAPAPQVPMAPGFQAAAPQMPVTVPQAAPVAPQQVAAPQVPMAAPAPQVPAQAPQLPGAPAQGETVAFEDLTKF